MEVKKSMDIQNMDIQGMEMLRNGNITCPYCGEIVDVLIDCSVDAQSYIEDCQVCCRPILISIQVDSEGDFTLVARHEND